MLRYHGALGEIQRLVRWLRADSYVSSVAIPGVISYMQDNELPHVLQLSLVFVVSLT